MSNKHEEQILAAIIEAARAKRLNRRGFMEGAFAAGLGLTAASTLWQNKVHAATPRKGGTFRVGVHDGNTTDTMDPGKYQAVGDIQLAHAHRSYLTLVTNENQLGGDIAKSWEAQPGAAEWRFRLFENVEFHSGKKCTSEDVIASLNHHRDVGGRETTSAVKALLADVTDIKADGDYGVVITLASGNADLPYLLSDYHFAVCPAKADGTIEFESMDGTGPYKIVEREAGVNIRMERHEAFHREGAYFDAIEMIILNDPNARQTALITGDVDAVTTVDLKTISLLQRAPGVLLDVVPSGSHVTLPMFCDTAPFDDVNARLALKYAINREEIIEKILFGYGTIGNDFPIAPTLPFWADIEQRSYDPDKARFHLKKAGMDSLSVDLSAADSVMSGAVDMCVLYAEQAKAAGININVVREPSDGYWSNVWLNKPFVFVQWGARPTPDVMYSIAYRQGADWNESRWENPRFNELLNQAKAELDETRRQDMYTEMHTLCRDDGGTIVPFFINRTGARRDNVQHPESIASNWELDGARGYERWWFSS